MGFNGPDPFFLWCVDVADEAVRFPNYFYRAHCSHWRHQSYSWIFPLFTLSIVLSFFSPSLFARFSWSSAIDSHRQLKWLFHREHWSFSHRKPSTRRCLPSPNELRAMRVYKFSRVMGRLDRACKKKIDEIVKTWQTFSLHFCRRSASDISDEACKIPPRSWVESSNVKTFLNSICLLTEELSRRKKDMMRLGRIVPCARRGGWIWMERARWSQKLSSSYVFFFLLQLALFFYFGKDWGDARRCQISSSSLLVKISSRSHRLTSFVNFSHFTMKFSTCLSSYQQRTSTADDGDEKCVCATMTENDDILQQP